MNRREFIAATVAAAAVPPVTGGEGRTAKAFGGWKPGEFQVHFIYTGVAESLFILMPDGTSMLLDCGDIPAIMRNPYDVPVPHPREMAGQTVADYVLRVNPRGRDVDYLVVSHWHSDHTGTPNWQSCGTMVDRSKGEYWRSGFGIAAERLRFARAVDRGFDDPIPYRDDRDRPGEHMRRLYDCLVRRDGLVREPFRLGATDQFVPRHGSAEGFSVRNIAGNGRLALPDGSVRDLYRGYLAAHSGLPRLNENGMSLGHVFSYGPFRFYTAGDFYDTIDGFCTEDAMAEACGEVDVAKINHHGHHSMSPRLVSALRARCYVACVWDQLHVTDDTMTRLADRSLYPGPRTFYPGVFTAERQREDAGKIWTADVAPAVRTKGAHVVLTVPPGGRTYTMTCLDATGKGLEILSVDKYETKSSLSNPHAV